MMKRRAAAIVAAFAVSYALCASAAAASDAGNAEPSALTSVRTPAHSPRRAAVAPNVVQHSVCEQSDAESLSGLQLVLGVTY
jgi:hypothetical protein